MRYVCWRECIPLDMFGFHEFPWQPTPGPKLLQAVCFLRVCCLESRTYCECTMRSTHSDGWKSRAWFEKRLQTICRGNQKAQLVELWSIKPAALVLNMNDHETSSFACISRCYTFAYWRVVVSRIVGQMFVAAGNMKMTLRILSHRFSEGLDFGLKRFKKHFNSNFLRCLMPRVQTSGRFGTSQTRKSIF